MILTSIISYNSLKLDPGSLRLEMEAVSRDLVARQVQAISKIKISKNGQKNDPTITYNLSRMREDLPLLPLYFELVPFVCRCAHSSMMGPPVVDSTTHSSILGPPPFYHHHSLSWVHLHLSPFYQQPIPGSSACGSLACKQFGFCWFPTSTSQASDWRQIS